MEMIDRVWKVSRVFEKLLKLLKLFVLLESEEVGIYGRKQLIFIVQTRVHL